MVNITRTMVAQKIVGHFLGEKVFLLIWMCTFRIWPLLEAAIMQAKLHAIKSQKVIV